MKQSLMLLFLCIRNSGFAFLVETVFGQIVFYPLTMNGTKKNQATHLGSKR